MQPSDLESDTLPLHYEVLNWNEPYGYKIGFVPSEFHFFFVFQVCLSFIELKSFSWNKKSR